MRDRKTTQVYDASYVADRYDRYYKNDRMSAIRAEVIESLLLLYDFLPQGLTMTKKGRLLDVGYGNGSFIREAARRGWETFGNDVNPTSYPGVRQISLPVEKLPDDHRYQFITFFDALEHFEELEVVSRVSLNTDWIVCSYPKVPAEWPWNQRVWKHFRPGEHHWFFTQQSLERLFTNERRFAKAVYIGSPEDWIRGKGEYGQPNIQTVALRIEKRTHTCASSGTGTRCE